MKKKRIVIFLYNKLFDPVVQSNFWLFISHALYSKSDKYEFHVISYESPFFTLTENQKDQLKNWKENGLSWSPLRWHSGLRLSSKVYDLIQGFAAMLKLRLMGYRYVMGFASVSGSMAYIYSVLLGYKLYIHSYEPHSEYAVDNQMWNVGSIQYRVLHFLERRSAMSAKVIVSASVFMEQRLKKIWGVNASYFKIPSVINDRKFIYRPADRNSVRSRLGISEYAWLLYYPGKFGDLYFKDETAWMFRWLSELNSRFHLLIVTQQKAEFIHDIFDRVGVNRSHYTVTNSSYEDIHIYASAADMGIIAVPPGPSKLYISNIKVGEYLCAGLPYLIVKGVSEDYIIASEYRVGIVVDDFDKISILNAYPEFCIYLECDKAELRSRCRDIGVKFRGFDNLNLIFESALLELTAD